MRKKFSCCYSKEDVNHMFFVDISRLPKGYKVWKEDPRLIHYVPKGKLISCKKCAVIVSLDNDYKNLVFDFHTIIESPNQEFMED